jgi:hypothetical protein
MEFAIPVTRFDPNNVTLNQPRSGSYKKTIPFGYTDNSLTFSSLVLSLEPLKVVEIDWDKNQLVLEEYTGLSFLSKLEQFQKLVNSQISTNFRKFLTDDELPDTLTILPLQSCVKSRRITLYLSNEPSNLPFFSDPATATGATTSTAAACKFSKNTVQPGSLLRVVVRLHGVSLQMTPSNIWTGKSRIQHHVLEVYKVSSVMTE